MDFWKSEINAWTPFRHKNTTFLRKSIIIWGGLNIFVEILLQQGKSMMEEKHKSGFVNIIGNPNVGKSTLMNALVGERLSIITSKAQTTRHRIMGIVNGDDFQIVYSDTPGILDPKYKMQESMLKFVHTAFADADIILYVTDVTEKLIRKENTFKNWPILPSRFYC